MKDKISKYCPNCYYPLPYKAKFCAHCGQKATGSKISMANLFKDIWFRVLHLESRSLHFIWRLFIPGLVTQEFFAGKQKRYPPPIRFFFVITFLFLLTLNELVGTDHLHLNTGQSKAGIQKEEIRLDPGFDLYEAYRYYFEAQQMRRQIDSLPENYRTPEVRAALDSLLECTHGSAIAELKSVLEATRKVQAENGNTLDTMVVNLGWRQSRIAMADVIQLEPDAIAAKYGVHSWVDKMMIRQGIKSIKDPKAIVKVYVGNLGWTILALITLLAGLFTLLYRREKRFYVEHFVFLLNQHSGMFLALTIAIWVNYFTDFEIHRGGEGHSFWASVKWAVWICLGLWLSISPLLAMRRFYGQSIGWTFLKWAFISLCYLMAFAFLFSAGALLAFFIF